MKFVDISGFGHSGKGVITDILREFEGYQVPHYNFEFNLLRIQGGLIDLKHALVDNWSPIRSDASIRRFYRLINTIGPKARFSSPMSLFYSNGMNYDDYFKGKFSHLSKNYIHSLISASYFGDWPYLGIDKLPCQRFISRMRSNMRFDNSLIDVYVSDPEGFQTKTQKFLNDLFDTVKEEGTKVIIMHNAFEPFNPVAGINLFDNAKLVVVQRDPRDIYASTIVSEGAFIPKYETRANWKLKRNMLGNTIDLFIERQALYFKHVNKDYDNGKVLRLQYEDVVLNYEKVLQQLYDFLGETPEIHAKKGEFFKPELSSKNVGLWKKMADQTVISRIESALKPYCYYEK